MDFPLQELNEEREHSICNYLPQASSRLHQKFNMHPWHRLCNSRKINVCLALWSKVRTHLSCSSCDTGPTLNLTGGDSSAYQGIQVHTHTHTHTHTRTHAHWPPQLHLYLVLVMLVRDWCNIFFILINCLGAIYFPLRRWRWRRERATLVRADKLLLTRRHAAGTRFARKTMSTRSETALSLLLALCLSLCLSLYLSFIPYTHTHLFVTLMFWGLELHFIKFSAVDNK